ncbi:50S ribosomal protein L29 [Plasmodium gonderi]|uniref:50S ribosomal protein L29 n=1 Tax=Plasmodium gonderi TaxID=77519 RepID=A0A1Y1JHQ3_PLAGO|nr:50S ribosomal protein L29 [Plasmodium gonderi]GAW80282.1 50S ribosomal protein L29 [Plasmodium gonderi]
MLNLSSLLKATKGVKPTGSTAADNENGENKGEIGSETVKIKLINMQEYKTKKLLDERKNVNAWSATNNSSKKPTKEAKKKTEKKKVEKKKDSKNDDENKDATKKDEAKKDDTKKDDTKKDDAKKDDEKKDDSKKGQKYEPPQKKFIPSVLKQRESTLSKSVKEVKNEKVEVFPDLLQAKKSTKTEKEKKKNQPQKKNKKDIGEKKKQEDEENNFPPIKEINKIHFNIFDVVDIKKEYERIIRNSDKVMQKYKNKKKFDNSMILCN